MLSLREGDPPTRQSLRDQTEGKGLVATHKMFQFSEHLEAVSVYLAAGVKECQPPPIMASAITAISKKKKKNIFSYLALA